MDRLWIIVLVALLAGGVLLVWLVKRNRSTPFQTVSLPGNVGTIGLPAGFKVEWEDDSTIIAFPENERIVFRLSSLSFSPKTPGEMKAKSFVAEGAAKKGRVYFELGDKGVQQYEEHSEENNQPLLIRYWEVGTKNTVTIISATTELRSAKSTEVTKTLQLVPQMLESLNIVVTHEILETDGGRIATTVETLDNAPPQSIRPLAGDDYIWLKESENHAKQLSLKYGSAGELDPEELDRIFLRWSGESELKESDESVADALGAAFGNYLVERHDFAWVVVDDEIGSEYAVRHAVRETMTFPVAAVKKRIEDEEFEFFQGLHSVIVYHLNHPQ